MGSCQAGNVIEINSQEDAKIISSKKRLSLSTKPDIESMKKSKKMNFQIWKNGKEKDIKE